MKSAFPQDLDDRNEYLPMVRWFSPLGLVKTLQQVIPSTLFGKYADARLIHAALNAIAPDTIIEMCCGGAQGVCGAKGNEPIWVDYVADLGDGFDSTYAVAYMIGQEQLQVNGQLLPRADCLIMGGDQVYPDASREDYKKRMQRPYRAAFPISSREGAMHPPIFMIPGNHDWYDGLGLFSALFCSGHNNKLGSWVTPQTRSYFATHLGNDWWIWGFDSQLGEDVDGPQSDYFDAVAAGMAQNSKVILCASVPTWLEASLTPADNTGRERFYKGAHFIASKLHKHRPAAKIPLVIAGDTHHYNRYEAKEVGTNFITAGGGGAFLHPTHKVLDESFDIRWLDGKKTTLAVARDPETGEESIYPPQSKSQKLALGNWLFAFENWDFSVFMSVVYWLTALLMLWWRGYGETGGTGEFGGRVWNQVSSVATTPIFALIALGFTALFVVVADKKSRPVKLVALLHAVLQVTFLLFWTAVISVGISGLRSITTVGEIAYFVVLALGMLPFGFLGGTLWGLYLTIASFFWGAESNNAFSALRLDSYKHFVRLKLEENNLTIYPIGIDESPKRSDWEFNQKCEDGNQNTPVIVPKKNPADIGQHFIEAPVQIDLDCVVRSTPSA